MDAINSTTSTVGGRQQSFLRSLEKTDFSKKEKISFFSAKTVDKKRITASNFTEGSLMDN